MEDDHRSAFRRFSLRDRSDVYSAGPSAFGRPFFGGAELAGLIQRLRLSFANVGAELFPDSYSGSVSPELVGKSRKCSDRGRPHGRKSVFSEKILRSSLLFLFVSSALTWQQYDRFLAVPCSCLLCCSSA